MISRVGTYLSQSVYSVATPFHPFGGAVDIIVVQQQDGSFRSTPWYVRFGKFQGVLKGAEKIVKIEVNGVEADFHMYLDNSGEAYFIKEIVPEKDSDVKDDFAPEKNKNVEVKFQDNLADNTESNSGKRFFDFHGQRSSSLDSSIELSGFGSNQFDNLENGVESDSSEVVLFSIDGQILSAPITSMEGNTENVQLSTPQFHLGPIEGPEFEGALDLSNGSTWAQYLSDISRPKDEVNESQSIVNLERELSINSVLDDSPSDVKKEDVFKSCLELKDLGEQENGADHVEELQVRNESEGAESIKSLKIEVKNNEGVKNVESGMLEVETESTDVNSLDVEHKVSDVETVKDQDGEELQVGNENEGAESIETLKIEIKNDEGVKNVESVMLEVGTESTEVNSLKIEHRVSDVEAVKDQDEELQARNEREDVESVESLKLEVKGVNGVESIKFEGESESTGVNSLDIEHEILGVEKDKDGEELEQAEDSPNGPEYEDGFPKSVTEGPEPYYDDNHKFDGPRQKRIELSLCGNLLRAGMGSSTASETFNAHRIPEEQFKVSAASIIKNDSLTVRIEDKYFTWDKVAHIVLGMAAYGLEMPVEPMDAIPVEWSGPRDDTGLTSTPSGRTWRLWPIPFRRAKTLDHSNSNISGEDVFLDSESFFDSPQSVQTSPASIRSPQKQFVRTRVPTTEQISSLKLKDGQNMVSFIFSTRVLGVQKVDAHIYLWKWNARIVISDVDGTITKSDVLGQFMPLVGKDWTQSGVARLFSAIKENGYQLLFLSARAIVQAYLTRSFLLNLKQDGKALPNGPVVISPDGLFPSLFREVIRRAPHEFKIACLEDIKALFPSDYNPFYAGFGNRDTDELSYRKIGIPKGKIFIINPKGEVAISQHLKGKSYTSLHTLVNDMFPPTSMVEQEDYNSWNYWRVPLPDVELQ